MSATVLVLDDLSEDGLRMLREAPGIETVVKTGLKGDGLRDALRQADGAICRSGVKITAESLEGNTRLRAIVRAGVGTDNIDREAATRQGIIVMNTPAGNTVSTAEHTMALLLGLARNIAPAHATLTAGRWDRKSFTGAELRGKTIGVVGLGRIGQAVALRCRAFEMQVIGFDPFLPRDRAAGLGIPLAGSIEELLPQADFLTVHTPLSAETAGLINSERLHLLRPGVRLINCARGGIYDEAALVAGLQSGVIGGVALDVFAEEPCTSSPLFGMPGVLVTPHLGASTEEAQRQVAVEAVELLTGYLQRGEIRHAVNAVPVDAGTARRLFGYLDLCVRLGMFLAQWHGGAISQCRLRLEGEIAAEDDRLLVSAFCLGLLRPVTDRVHFINAAEMARERGIELVRESAPEHGAFASLVSATVSGNGLQRRAAGTVFGRQMPRLVRLDQFQLEAYLDGHLLLVPHDDVPGIIGYMGQELAAHRINIAQMTVGRAAGQAGRESIGVLNLDSPAPADAIARIEQHPRIGRLAAIHLPAPGAETGLPGG